MESDDHWFYGDAGPWTFHLATAWQAAAGRRRVDLPIDPTDSFLRSERTGGDSSRERAQLIAYWAPLLHLTCYGLGWARPDIGLQRWLQQGCPLDDPVLRVIHAWWGPHRISDFLAWAASNPAVGALGQHVLHEPWADPSGRNTVRLPDDHAERRLDADWQAVWGGGTGPLHLLDHATAPGDSPPSDEHHPYDPMPYRSWAGEDDSKPVRRALITDTYASWYLLFRHYQWQRENHHAIRIDVICRPVGWLGTFRYSRTTDTWFRGRRHIHLLGQ